MFVKTVTSKITCSLKVYHNFKLPIYVLECRRLHRGSQRDSGWKLEIPDKTFVAQLIELSGLSVWGYTQTDRYVSIQSCIYFILLRSLQFASCKPYSWRQVGRYRRDVQIWDSEEQPLGTGIVFVWSLRTRRIKENWAPWPVSPPTNSTDRAIATCRLR
jgi:hypothetical protein